MYDHTHLASGLVALEFKPGQGGYPKYFTLVKQAFPKFRHTDYQKFGYIWRHPIWKDKYIHDEEQPVGIEIVSLRHFKI